MRQRRDILDSGDLQSRVLQLNDGLLAAGAGAFDFQASTSEHAPCLRACWAAFSAWPIHGGEGRALAGTLKPDRAGRRPGEGFPVGVGDGHHRVVERRVDVGDAARDALAYALFFGGGFPAYGGQCGFCCLPAIAWFPLEKDPRGTCSRPRLADAGNAEWSTLLRPAFIAFREILYFPSSLTPFLPATVLRGTLAGAGIGSRPLAANRKRAAAMPVAAIVSADVAQARRCSTESAAAARLASTRTPTIEDADDLGQLLLAELLGPALVRIDAGLFQDNTAVMRPDAVDVSKAHPNRLVSRNVDTCRYEA